MFCSLESFSWHFSESLQVFQQLFWSVSIRTGESIHLVVLPPICKPYTLIVFFCLSKKHCILWAIATASILQNHVSNLFHCYPAENRTLHKHSLPSLIPNVRHDFSPCRDKWLLTPTSIKPPSLWNNDFSLSPSLYSLQVMTIYVFSPGSNKC